ncbi:ketohydroxyglutarate aldolase [Phormidesmis priestleyi ULC007]|uniref:Ketohydroxyglutarate aldolase n=1 Tax=Phormidesmis priestleyi ULC007 TaxID=1920490 RepID=A0A2T1DC54_9CYAN|nr:bifunctional 4-hydroxy-2-oxoglutarate aldolase/2-dehydro-3-deoxy-phosphogluconate aldolase [Phormidesmis priestleyi]PSB18011.1 ketohydroxyglutarate aldolase [Phormidesmis priestleyi ULC007]PZO49351.1 MAG: ketohydroxyglutarate aldolase [Phormidesmis priestleyi]
MKIQSWLTVVRQQRAIAVIRASDFELGRQMAKAVAAGGMKLIEITWDSDRPAKLIHQLQSELPDCTIGTGTVLTLEQLQGAIAAKVAFVFTPHINVDLIRMAVDRDIPIIPGALTPTEIVTAWQAGASSVKVFPVQALGGANYIRSLQAPIGQIPLIPTGGVTFENAPALIEAGAVAIGLAGSLFPQQAMQSQNWEAVTQQAKTLMKLLNISPMRNVI